jgi:ER protein Pkr1
MTKICSSRRITRVPSLPHNIPHCGDVPNSNKLGDELSIFSTLLSFFPDIDVTFTFKITYQQILYAYTTAVFPPASSKKSVVMLQGAIDLILVPGSSLKLVPVINLSVLCLLIVLCCLTYSKIASIHLVVMSFLALGLLASVNW